MREGYPTGPAFGSHYGRVGYNGRPTLGRRFERRPLGGVEGVKTSLGRYTQAILAKAFRGDLVATEAELARSEGRGFESASALLDRIHREVDARAASVRPKKASPRARKRVGAGR